MNWGKDYYKMATIRVCDRCRDTKRKCREVWFKCRIGNPGKEVYHKFDLCMECEITILRLILEKINNKDPSTINITNNILYEEVEKK